MKKNKVTIRDISEKSGISKSSVALALQDKYGVSASKRAKVLLTAYELGYDFDSNYKKNGRSQKKIALLISDDYVVTEHHWAEIINDIECKVIENGCFLEIINYSSFDDLNALAFKLRTEGYLGAVIIHYNLGNLIEALDKEHISTIVIEPKYFANGNFSSIMPNDYIATRKVAAYLYEMGHRRICFFGNVSHNDTFIQRFNGFKDFFRGVKDVDFVSIIASNPGYSLQNSDFDSFRCTFSSENYPTAILCANDQLAYATVKELEALGLSVPDDVSVVGVGNSKLAYEITPHLTTISFNRTIIGDFVVDYLINHEFTNMKGLCFQFPVDLVINESVIKRDYE